MAKAYTHKTSYWNETNINELLDLYINQNLSCKEIAKLKNCTYYQVLGGIQRFNIHKTKEKQLLVEKRIMNDPILKETIVKNNIIKYGVKSPNSLPEIKTKKKETCIIKYGFSNPMKNDRIKKKGTETRFKRYNKYVPDTQENKRIQTCLKKYGVANPFQIKDFHKTAWLHYKYDNNTFDSSWELAFYIWAKDNNKSIIREPTRFYYYDNQNKKHFYTPDFLYDEKEYIEIKGPHFLDKDNNLINCRTKQILKSLQECLKNNKVKLILKKDIIPILNYIKRRYGKDYLKQFKLKPNLKTKVE